MADLQVRLDAWSRREERTQVQMLSHAYVVSRWVWTDKLPPFAEVVRRRPAEALLDDAERTDRDAQLWRDWYVRTTGETH